MASGFEPSMPRPARTLVAPLWHTLGLLLAISLGLLHVQSLKLAAGEQHHGNVILYLSVIASEWALSFYVWLGGVIPGATRVLRTLAQEPASGHDCARLG